MPATYAGGQAQQTMAYPQRFPGHQQTVFTQYSEPPPPYPSAPPANGDEVIEKKSYGMV